MNQGAQTFRVLCSKKFNQKVGVKGSVGAQRVAKLQSSISQTAYKTRKNSSLQVEEIGKITVLFRWEQTMKRSYHSD
jgi:hypothetical protein